MNQISPSPTSTRSFFPTDVHAPSRTLYSIAMAAADADATATGKPLINLNKKVPSDDHLQALDSPALVANASARDAPASIKATLAAATASPVNDVGRRMRRAERFGMPVQLSEEEKRSSRAERFGTTTGANKSDVLGKSEELKRKARAERFGMPISSTPLDEEAKKKARSARFSGGLAADPQEEDKRKLRAIRFSDIPKTALVGKAGGVA